MKKPNGVLLGGVNHFKSLRLKVTEKVLTLLHNCSTQIMSAYTQCTCSLHNS